MIFTLVSAAQEWMNNYSDSEKQKKIDDDDKRREKEREAEFVSIFINFYNYQFKNCHCLIYVICISTIIYFLPFRNDLKVPKLQLSHFYVGSSILKKTWEY